MKNVLDEREQQALNRIEHKALSAIQILLVAAVVIQLLMGADFIQIAGECVAMIAVSLGMIVGYVYYGLWDTDAEPSRAGNVRYALVSALCVGLLVGGLTRKIGRAALAGFLMFLLTFVLLNLLMKGVEKRRRQQEEAYEEDEDA